MTHDEQRIWMIQYLLSEKEEYSATQIPDGVQDQKNLLRSLMNVRIPAPISREFLEIQDDYLTVENRSAGITDVNHLSPLKVDDRLTLWQGDMTSLRIDSIVNPANSALLGCFCPLHNCADNIVHSKSGIQLRLKCSEIMRAQGHDEPTGRAKITPAYNLPCQYILHTVGPIIRGRVTSKERELLASCYRSCLKLAADNGLKSIAFCCISTGEFHFPNEEAAEIAVKTVKEFLQADNRIQRVVFNVYKDIDLLIYRRLLGEDL
jgi:O-acetyl-ADP-ribose deacetylase (regulator of RNase III)